MNLPSVVLFLSICSVIFQDGHNQVIDGFEAREYDFTYKVAILRQFSYQCGGGIIDTIHVITAAHCVYNYSVPDLMIIAGVTDLTDRRRVLRTIKKIHVPEDFPNNRRSNDIAILTLDEPFTLGGRITTIPYLPQEASYDNTICWFTGWGLPHEALSSDYELKLRWTPLEIVPNVVCECMVQSRMPAGLLCAMDTKRTAKPAIGDSGGPIVCDGVVVGVLSIRLPALNSPSFFSSIYYHSTFINESLMD